MSPAMTAVYSFNSLPPELKQLPFSYLSETDHARVVRTCREWHQLSHQPFADIYSPNEEPSLLPAARIKAVRALLLKTPIIRHMGRIVAHNDVRNHHGLFVTDEQATITNCDTGESRSLQIGNRPIRLTRLLSPNRFFTLDRNSTVTVWEMGEGNPVWAHTSPVPIESMTKVVASDGYLAWNRGHSVAFYDLEKQEARSFEHQLHDGIIGFSRDRLYTCDFQLDTISSSFENDLYIYSLDIRGNRVWTSHLRTRKNPTNIGVIGSTEKEVVVTASDGEGSEIYLLDKDKGNFKATVTESDPYLTGQVFGQYLAAPTHGALDIWHIPSRTLFHTQYLKPLISNAIFDLTVAPEKIACCVISDRHLYSIEYDPSKPDDPATVARTQASPLRRMYENTWRESMEETRESVLRCFRVAKDALSYALGPCLRKKKRE